MTTTVEYAGAKVTLSLRVKGVRDDGYHELDALAAIVDEPHDELSIIDDASNALVVEPPGSAPEDESNLVWRARAALGSAAGLRLRKGIPTEAGLGGGSADAAAALRLLQQGDDVFPLTIYDIAESLGADVPVCLGGSLHRMRGIGDALDALVPPAAPTYLVIATPTFGCATAAVYKAWDALGGPVSSREIAPSAEWMHATNDERPWRNDLEPAAIDVEPRLAEFRDELARVTGAFPMLCGSGSTYYVMASDRAHAEAMGTAVREQLATRCVAVATVGRTSGR